MDTLTEACTRMKDFLHITYRIKTRRKYVSEVKSRSREENGKENKLMFDNRALFALLLPIIIEQILNSFMGMVDTVMVSNVGSAAISAVSLVDSINNLVIQVFSAMAAGLPLSAQDLSGRKTGTAVTVRHDRLC